MERGGNGILVSVFGSAACSYDDGTPYRCNLHGVWDTEIIAHRRHSDRQYLADLERQIKQRGWDIVETGSPAHWAMESHALAKAALLPAEGVVDEGTSGHRSRWSMSDWHWGAATGGMAESKPCEYSAGAIKEWKMMHLLYRCSHTGSDGLAVARGGFQPRVNGRVRRTRSCA